MGRTCFSASWLGHMNCSGPWREAEVAVGWLKAQDSRGLERFHSLSCNSAVCMRTICLSLPAGPQKGWRACRRAVPKPRPDQPTPSWSADLGDIINENAFQPLHGGWGGLLYSVNWHIIKLLPGRLGLQRWLVGVHLIRLFFQFAITIQWHYLDNLKRILTETRWLLS